MSERFLAEALAAVGIAREKLVLSLANNHVLDQGVAGFDETRGGAEAARHPHHRPGRQWSGGAPSRSGR